MLCAISCSVQSEWTAAKRKDDALTLYTCIAVEHVVGSNMNIYLNGRNRWHFCLKGIRRERGVEGQWLVAATRTCILVTIVLCICTEHTVLF